MIIRCLVGLRNTFSNLLNKRRFATIWRPSVVSLEQFEKWMIKHFKYKHDPLGGIIDNTQGVGHMCFQYQSTGEIQGDCDDSATMFLWAVTKLRKGGAPIGNVWRVNIPAYTHVICVWEYLQQARDPLFQYSSGVHIYPPNFKVGAGWASMREVVDAYGNRREKKRIGVAYYAEPAEKIRL